MSADTSLKNILLLTDFSELSDNALHTAIAMCKRHGATLHMLHIIETSFIVGPTDPNASAFYMIPEPHQNGKEDLLQLENEIHEKYGINVRSYIEAGSLSDIIRNKVPEFGCELIVMSSDEVSGIKEFFFGSKAFAIIKNTNIPVLTIPGDTKIKDFKKILFPIRVVHGILDKYDLIEPIIEKNNATLSIVRLLMTKEIKKQPDMEGEINWLFKILRDNNTKHSTEFHTCRNYAKKVLEIAISEKADLIAINASLNHEWQHFFSRPYAQQIVNHSKIPVLTIRQTKDASPLFYSSSREIKPAY
jgi:nucleotide-binding universal stress UspA family protein